MVDRQRLDKYLAAEEYFTSRSQAKRAIMAGEVYVNGEQVDKAGTPVTADDDIEIKGDPLPYVSRGGLKLEKAFKVFSLDVEAKEAFDVGASTGGFTDCLLQHGASLVYAIDVGYGQLAWKLRQDQRVRVIERTNFRHLEFEDLPVMVPLIVIDVSFISLRLIIPRAREFLEDNGSIVALIKPQFEAGKERVGNGGVIKDSRVHLQVIEELSVFFADEGLAITGLDYSPITGATGHNIEFLALLKSKQEPAITIITREEIVDTVDRAHRELGRG